MITFFVHIWYKNDMLPIKTTFRDSGQQSQLQFIKVQECVVSTQTQLKILV